MATADVRLTHFCHICNERINATFQESNPTCPRCHQGFVEELDSSDVSRETTGLSPLDLIPNLMEFIPAFMNAVIEDGSLANNRESAIPVDGPLLPFLMLLNRNLALNGPPPADATALSRLPKRTLTSENIVKSESCPICFDDYAAGEVVITLPCEHFFHENCITRWLKEHGTCPICRKNLAGHDTSDGSSSSGFDGFFGASVF
uniref:RING-type E3 ubiquitin transferase n=2 Tax=Schistocephalus solidus TaxID=70667 RepID=A0A0X3P4M6_SCHSO